MSTPFTPPSGQFVGIPAPYSASTGKCCYVAPTVAGPGPCGGANWGGPSIQSLVGWLNYDATLFSPTGTPQWIATPNGLEVASEQALPLTDVVVLAQGFSPDSMPAGLAFTTDPTLVTFSVDVFLGGAFDPVNLCTPYTYVETLTHLAPNGVYLSAEVALLLNTYLMMGLKIGSGFTAKPDPSDYDPPNDRTQNLLVANWSICVPTRTVTTSGTGTAPAAVALTDTLELTWTRFNRPDALSIHQLGQRVSVSTVRPKLTARPFLLTGMRHRVNLTHNPPTQSHTVDYKLQRFPATTPTGASVFFTFGEDGSGFGDGMFA